MAQRKNINHIYNPKNQSKEELVEGFVVRLPLFHRLFEELKSSRMEFPEQHFLLVGKRGMGKTTLLLRLAIEIERTPSIQSWMIPIVFNEEEYGVRKLFRFWERIIELLIEKDTAFRVLRSSIESLSSSLQKDLDYEKALFQELEKVLQEKGKKVLLFIDNFGDMFSKFSEHEARRLRKILQTSAEFRILGASSVVMEAFYMYNYPFYEFFKVERLEGLTAADTQKLLLNLADRYGQQTLIRQIIEQQPGRIESLRRLTGGVIRTMILLFEIFIDEESTNALQDIESILDRVTPLYKHRMEDLPAQQQEIVETVALNWDAISVAEIRNQLRLDSKVISAQLQQLVKLEIIRKIPTRNKNHLYQLSERFFNIWFLMRHGRRNDKRRVLWLVRFLEEWCDESELEDRVNKQIALLQGGDMEDKAAYLLSEALAHTKLLSQKKQHELLVATHAYLEQRQSVFKNQLSQSDIQLQATANRALAENAPTKALPLFKKMKHRDYFGMGKAYQQLGELKKAEEAFNKAIQGGRSTAFLELGRIYKVQYLYTLANAYFQKALEADHAEALLELADVATRLEDKETAKTHFLSAIQRELPTARRQLAELYIQDGAYNEGLEQLMRAYEAGDSEAPARLREVAHQLGKTEIAEAIFDEARKQGEVQALTHLGRLYREEKQLENAERILLEALDKGDKNACLELGLLYKLQGMQDKAEVQLLAALEAGIKDSAYHLAKICRLQGQNEKAANYYRQAIELGNLEAPAELGRLYLIERQYDDAEIFLKQAVDQRNSNAMKDLADLYRRLGKEDKAEAYFKQAIDNGDIDAINKLAYLYFSLGKIDLAEKYFQQAAQKGNLKAYSNLGYMYHDLRQMEKAEVYYQKCADRKDPVSMNNLAFLYYEWKRKKTAALELSKEAYLLKPDVDHSLTYAKVLAWNDRLEESIEVAQDFLYEEKMLSRHYFYYFQDYLLLLMAKGQNDFLLGYFRSEAAQPFQLIDRFKPLYYALMHQAKDEHPNAYLRMGPELQGTVQEILEKAEAMKIAYA